jgi:restriction system protein
LARRKSKAKQQEELIKGIFGLVGLGSFFITYYLTQSFNTAVGVGMVSIAIVISIMIILYIKKVERLKKSGMSDIDKMEGTQFENYLVHLFRAQGYDAKVTQPIGDFGADLIISKNGKKIAVQAKRYSKNVGIKAVQEAQASIAHYGASEGWVISNRDYTEAAYTLALSNQIRLINREALIEMILQINSKPTLEDR